MILSVEEVGLLEGWQMNSNRPKISILQFAEGTLMFTNSEVN